MSNQTSTPTAAEVANRKWMIELAGFEPKRFLTETGAGTILGNEFFRPL